MDNTNNINTDEHMNIIKKFYTYLGDFIEIGEYNDPEEVEFLSEYLSKFDDEYEKWYNAETEDEEDEEGTDSDDSSESSTSNSSESPNQEMNGFFWNNLGKSTSEQNDEENLKKILNNENFEDILLYKKNNKSMRRLENYLNSINRY